MHTTIDPTPRSSRGRRPLSRTGVVLGTAVLLVLGLLGPAQAKTTVERGTWQEGLFYGNGTFLLLAGASVQDWCDNEPVHDAKYRISADGTEVMTVAPTKVWDLYLYETELEAPAFVAAVCAGIMQPPAPVAAGEGRMKLRIAFDTPLGADGPPGRIVNSSWGTVTFGDGVTWRVRGRADLELECGATGCVPTTDPSEFQSLQIVRTGR